MSPPASKLMPVVETLDLSDLRARDEADAFVMLNDAGMVFHRTAWSAAVEKGTGNRSHYLVTRDVAGRLTGLLPLSEIKSSLFGKALVSAGFGIGGGVLANDPKSREALIETAVALAKSLSCPTLELRGGSAMGEGFTQKSDVYLNFEREIAGDREQLLLLVPRKQRAEIRKSFERDLEVRIGTSEQDRADHFAVYAESVRNLGTPVFPRALFDAMLDEFGKDADILTVSKNGRALASVLSFYHKGVVMPYWGGGIRDARIERANDHLYFALMEHAVKRGCNRFDFGRSKVGTGPASFKKNWGFEGQPLSYAVWIADGSAPRDINPLSPKYRMQVAIWQKLPLAIANRVGPLIARGLG